ncbi:hypothetical protein [Nocardiopsis composta]|uniref:Uncharacterized protein n=1 Tax=Nocardiopsis composta TaxID=157465 RepID=A0A7W8QMZ2_9ACTN|nr:hypothetical protein [Nocardiopsis composta]MBB5433408.1 hypothetical protein [Nocardiopsis composta]
MQPSPKDGLKLVLPLLVLCTAAACGNSGAEPDSAAGQASPDASPSASASPSVSPSASPSPEPSTEDAAQSGAPEENPAASPETPEEQEADDPHPLAGRWEGPMFDSGQGILDIEVNGFVSMQQGDFRCNGNADPAGDGSFVITFTECIVPLPAATATLSADGTTLTTEAEGETDEWRLVEGD